MSDNRITSNALSSGLAILDLLAGEPEGLRTNQIARALDIAPSTTSRLLATLVEQRYVDYVTTGRAYRMNFKLLDISHRMLDNLELTEKATPYLRDLHTQTGLLTTLGVLSRDMVVTIARMRPHHPRSGDGLRVGVHTPANASSKGKVILASLPDDAVEEFLAVYPPTRLTSRTPVTREAITASLAKIRAQGYYVNRGERQEGWTGISAPVRNYRGDVVAAAGVSSKGMPDDWPDEHTVALVVETAERISFSLGYHQGAINSSLPFAPGGNGRSPERRRAAEEV